MACVVMKSLVVKEAMKLGVLLIQQLKEILRMSRDRHTWRVS
jgi:hypothetical protein